MDISKRLKAVAALVKHNTIADIGTDHGYVPIFLLKEGVIEKAVACDINKGPIDKADMNVRMYHLSHCIDTRLGRGLCPVNKGEVDTAVIAGMGGMLIIDILKESADVVNSLKQLVLQPQLDIDRVRRYIHSIGFKIEEEVMIYEDGKFYTAMSCVKGNEEYSGIEYLYGKRLIEKKDETLKQYIESRISKFDFIISQLSDKNTENSERRLEEAEKEIKICREVLECL